MLIYMDPYDSVLTRSFHRKIKSSGDGEQRGLARLSHEKAQSPEI